MREKSLQTRIYRELNALPDCKALVTRGLEAGTPDIMGCHGGRMFLLEVKAGEYRPTAIQRYRMRQWREAGALCAVADEAFCLSHFLRIEEDER